MDAKIEHTVKRRLCFEQQSKTCAGEVHQRIFTTEVPFPRIGIDYLDCKNVPNMSPAASARDFSGLFPTHSNAFE